MKIVNASDGSIISENAELRKSFFGRFRGLMFSGRKDIVLESMNEDIISSTIHMLFMLYPIDVVWVDPNMKVVDFQKQVMPFNPLKPRTAGTYKPDKPAKYVIELGKTKLGRISVGDIVDFK